MVVIKVLPQGLYTVGPGGRLVLDPPAKGAVMWVCRPSGRTALHPCGEPIPLLDPALEVGERAFRPTSLVEIDDRGRPVFVWLSTSFLEYLEAPPR